MATAVLLGLGANVGDALATLNAAVYALDDVDGLAVADVSGVYETPPWPPPGTPGAVAQDPFLNLVVRAVTSLEPRALLAELHLVEAAFGRDRASEVRWGPRPLDIDVLTYGELTLDEPDLTIPHPRMHERAFVLVPALEVAPGGSLPDGRRFTQLLAALAPIEDIELVVRLEDVPGNRVARPEGPQSPPASFTRPSDELANDTDAAAPDGPSSPQPPRRRGSS